MNIGHYLVAAARSCSDRPAVSLGDSTLWSYGEFAERVARLAAGLRALPGVERGDRVGLAMPNGPEYLEVLHGVWHAGLCAVPVNAKLHPRELAYILQNSGCRVCFASEAIAHGIEALGRGPALVCPGGADYDRLLAASPMPLSAAGLEEPAWLFYTSGTTGRPKGAILSHRALAEMTLRYYADIDHLTPDDCVIHAAPLSHATGLYSIPFTAKAAHHIIPESRGYDTDELAALSRRYSSISMFMAPTMLTRLMHAPALGSLRREAIRTIYYGGAPMYLEDLKQAIQVFGTRLVQVYGQGEMPMTLTYLPHHLHRLPDDGRHGERLASVGMARTGVELRIVGPDGEDCPPGEIGEVAARSEVCMEGYWANPQATEAALRDGWLFTGDLGVMDRDGFVTLKDRSKDVIISGGSNIYPREVEEVLLMHPNVLEAAVIGRADPDWGEAVVAYVVTRDGCSLESAELDGFCLENIARFKRPKEYFFVESLPTSDYGKILKTDLRAGAKYMSRPAGN